MATQMDMRRADLIVPYQAPPAAEEVGDLSTSISSTLPMAAMFTRNKFVGWASLVYSLQTWLGESAESKANSTTPGYFSVGMAFMALVVTYLPVFMPPTGKTPAAAPPPTS